MMDSFKLYAGFIGTAIMGVLYFIFTARGRKIDELEEEQEKLKVEAQVVEKKNRVSDEVREQYLEDLDEIEEHYDEETLKVIEKYDDKPLSPTLLSKLRQSQGVPASSDNTPK